MADLKAPFWIHLKGWLFLVILLTCFGLLVVENPTLRVAALLCLLVWSSARFYYYLFYVIENYVDANFKFAGVLSAIRYWWHKRGQ